MNKQLFELVPVQEVVANSINTPSEWIKDCPDYPPAHHIVLIDFGNADLSHSGQYAVATREIDRDIQFGITTVQYLHSLMNLYFSLTGEELKIDSI